MMNSNFVAVNPAFCTDGPSPADLVRNEDMEMYLYKNGTVYETQAGEHNRVYVIDKLRVVATEWATALGKSKSVADEHASGGGGIQLRVFGSTRLGVHNTDSDVDLLCLAPSFITRADFFGSFLETLAHRHDVDSILSVPEAYTPVLKFTMDGQAVDMVFASLQLQTLPVNLDILDVRCLKGLDDASVRSINGARVAEWICRLTHNTVTYCVTLRIIKYWARQRGMYSNMLGFLGGVNYAILVAMVCQMYPNACPFTLVQKFFEIYAIWPWPSPVMLRSYEDLQVQDTDGRYLQVWNAKSNYKDALHIMPIITPAYPAMNSAYNVSPPQFRAFQDEVQRACSIFQRHENERRFPWGKLFESSTREFFQRHPRYVQIDISALNIDDQRNWFGWVESRLRLLILALEQPPMVFCHPIANCFHRSPPDIPDFCRSPALQNASDVVVHQTVLDSQQPATVTSSSARSAFSTAATTATSETSDTTATAGTVSTASSTRSPSPAMTETEGGSGTSSDVRGEVPDATSVAGTNAMNAPPRPTTPPTQKAAAPKKKEQQNEKSTNPDEVSCYTSTFIIGLSFQLGTRFCDVGPAIQEFDYKVKSWSGKKPGMDIKICIFSSSNIPPFVFRTKAEPSNVESCTPKPHRIRKDSLGAASEAFVDGSALPAVLFPGSAVKAPIHRESSDSSLSQGLSNHSISEGSPTASRLNRGAELSPRGPQQHSPRAHNSNSASPRTEYPRPLVDFRISHRGPGSPRVVAPGPGVVSVMPPLPPPSFGNGYGAFPQDIGYQGSGGNKPSRGYSQAVTTAQGYENHAPQGPRTQPMLNQQCYGGQYISSSVPPHKNGGLELSGQSPSNQHDYYSQGMSASVSRPLTEHGMSSPQRGQYMSQQPRTLPFPHIHQEHGAPLPAGPAPVYVPAHGHPHHQQYQHQQQQHHQNGVDGRQWEAQRMDGLQYSAPAARVLSVGLPPTHSHDSLSPPKRYRKDLPAPSSASSNGSADSDCNPRNKK